MSDRKLLWIPGGQLSKYAGEQSKWHDGELTWPGIRGVPAINYTPKTDEPVLKVAIFNYFHVKLFDLSNQEDFEHYTWCQDRIQNGWFLMNKSEYKWAENGMKIYMEWIQRYVKQITVQGYSDVMENLIKPSNDANLMGLTL